MTPDEIRAAEQAAFDSGITPAQLMESAGTIAAEVICRCYPVAEQSAHILCGNGNNGGDGFVIARKLANLGANVTVVMTSGIPKTEQALEMLNKLRGLKVTVFDFESEPYVALDSVREASLVVDAVYGIGFRGAVPAKLHNLFRLVNNLTVPVVCVDVPSGLNAVTGEADTETVRADITVTFAAEKDGMLTEQGRRVCGKVATTPIGIEKFLPNSAPVKVSRPDNSEITLDEVLSCFSPRLNDSNKGDYGRLLTVCGSAGMMGAAVLALKAALRMGVGIVESALPRSLYPIAASMLCEPVFCLLDEASDGTIVSSARPLLRERSAKADAVLIGCGLGCSEGAAVVVSDLLSNCACPVILDADGINIAAEHNIIGKTVRSPLIITPHPGEMARLMHTDIAAIQGGREGAARSFAEEHGIVVVLKGHRTVIAAPGMAVRVNTTGNPGMATGGSGDVLAGMISSLVAQGMGMWQAAMCGTYLHGLAGDIAARRLSQRAMLPSDMIDELGELLLDLESRIHR